MKSTTAGVAAVALLCIFTDVAKRAGALDLPPEMKEIVEAAHNSCKDETGVDEALLKQALKGVLADDPKLKCFIKCMFQRLQAMRDDGTMDVELVEATLPPELKEHGAMDALNQCLPTPGKELCQSAYDVLSCIHRVNPELSKLFE